MDNPKRDVSNKTIAILFIVTLLISAVGTFMVVKNINDIQVERKTIQQEEGDEPIAVSLEVKEPPVSAGSIVLNVQPRPADV
ncbi:hypothetical protein GF345_02065 [Candidatus Woesearchaeota archaeon]|nr:hypothetical protein [Candidatus Woesearchaeota archaeon]